MKNSFVIYADYLEHILLLSMEQRGLLFTSLISYASGEDLPVMDGMTKMAFSFIKSQMDRDREKYEKTVQARREAGKRGGRPTKTDSPKEKQEKAKKANGFLKKQTETKKPDNDTDNENVTDTDINKNTSCPVAETAPASPIVISFRLNDNSLYDVTENDVEYFQQLYPAVDCMAELRKIAGWCDANPKNRKTRNGAKRFLNAWMARAQDRAPKMKEGGGDGAYESPSSVRLW